MPNDKQPFSLASVKSPALEARRKKKKKKTITIIIKCETYAISDVI